MIIWRGWGGVAAAYAAIAMMLFAGLASTMLPSGALPFSISVGLVLAAAATWLTGVALNRTSPQRQIDAWAEQRMAQLDELVRSGRFSLGPGQPQPTSLQEAEQMADALFAYELEQAKQAIDRNTLFWVPMQYFAFVWGAIAVVVLVSGIVGALRG